MNIQQLLTEKCIGLIDNDTGEHIRWYETTADEVGMLDVDDDGNIPDDYDCYGLSGFLDGDFHYFRTDAELVTVDDLRVKVTSMTGREFTFTLYRQVKTSELVTSDHPRAINLADARMETTEPNRLWLKVGKFDVLLNHTDEGLAVDIWPWVEKDAPVFPDEPLATCYAFDTDADAALETEDGE